MEDIKEYFSNKYISTDTDSHVKQLVQQSRRVLDVGCGDNLFKKHIQVGTFVGLDPFNKNADIMCDILEYETSDRFDLIICFGSINFYDIKWVDDRMKKVASLLDKNGRICMKVNPNKPFGNGVILNWFDRWTLPLIDHYAEMFNYRVESIREGERGRIKFDYVAR